MVEIWKDITELENYYQISNLGRVQMKQRITYHSFGIQKSQLLKARICKEQDNGNGYKQLYVSVDGKRKLNYIHRLVAKYFVSNSDPINKLQVNHIDGINSNNRYDNLEWVTKGENMKHASDNNLIKKGITSPSAKLTENTILALRRLYRMNPKFNKSEIARKLNVGDPTIHKIIKRQRWKHI